MAAGIAAAVVCAWLVFGTGREVPVVHAQTASSSPVATGAPPPVVRPAAPAEPLRQGSGVKVPASIRVAGTVEAVRARTVIVPRMAGQTVPTLVITKLPKPGSRVKVGDILVEFDRQEQQRIARDRQAELIDLDNQIAKKKADQATSRARDESELTSAQHDVDRARMETLKNPFLPAIDAEKTNLGLEQQTARLKQLQDTFALKRKAAEADLRIVEIRRERSERARQYAEGNAALMEIRSTFSGVVVLKSMYKGMSMGEVLEGDEVRPGLPILDVVDPSIMQVRARVNQADASLIHAGQVGKVRLDAYPDLVFDGKVEFITPIAVMSQITPKVRQFVAVISIKGKHERLMPDLSASIDLPTTAVPVKPVAPAPRAPGGRP